MAINFAGGASRAFIPFTTVYQIGTYAIWVYKTGTPSGWVHIIGRMDTDNGFGLSVYDGHIRLSHYNGSTSGIYAINSGWTNFPTNVWTHLAVTYDHSSNSNIPVFYRNGQVQTTSTWQTPNSTNIQTHNGFAIGNHAGVGSGESLSRIFGGRLAEVGYWNAVLTAGEVAALANGFSPSRVRAGALKLYVPLVRSADARQRSDGVLQGTTSVVGHPKVLTSVAPYALPQRRYRRLYINTVPSNTGRKQHPYTNWNGGNVYVERFSMMGLTGNTVYFQTVDENNVESPWYGPVSVNSLGPVITAFNPAGPWIVGDTGRQLIGTGFGA